MGTLSGEMAATESGLDERPSRRSVVVAFGIAIAAAVALIAVAVISRNGSSAPPPTANPVVDLAGIPQQGPVLGSPNAKVTLIEYADPQCPACRAVHGGDLPDARGRLRPARQGQDGVPGLPVHRRRLGEGVRLPARRGRAGQALESAEALYRNQGRENSGWVTDDLVRAARR